jgi:hypothetical protein
MYLQKGSKQSEEGSVKPVKLLSIERVMLQTSVVDPDPELFGQVGSGSEIIAPVPDLFLTKKYV